MNKFVNDVIIIGSGPAGIACAIQLKRSGIEPVVFEKNRIGGLLCNANLVENYPGFPGGISGDNLALLLKKQLLSEKIKVIRREVKDINYLNNKFIVKAGNESYFSKMVVNAAGTNPKKLEGYNFRPAAEKKVCYEVYKINKIANKRILIIGAGDLAFDYALNLGVKNNITLICRSARVSCLPLLYKRAMKLRRFECLENTTVESINISSANQLQAVIKTRRKKNIIFTDYILPAIGRYPAGKFPDPELAGKLRKKRKLFVIGDAANKQYRQASIAAGDGVKAAMIIYEKLKGIR